MTSPETVVTNTASDGAHVGVQAQVIHGGVHNSYHLSPDATPKQRYDVGVNYLRSGSPLLARRCIEQAIARSYDGSEVRFHWLLALLSGRTSRQLSAEEASQLDTLAGLPVARQAGPWSAGIRALLDLLSALRSPGTDLGPPIDAIENLPPEQRNLIVRHVAALLHGSKGTRIWEEAARAAQENRYANGRVKRAKYFFYLDPAPPYPREPVPARTSSRDLTAAAAVSAVFVLAMAGITAVLALHASILGLAALLACCAGLGLAFSPWTELRWRRQRQAEHQRLLTPAPGSTARDGAAPGGSRLAAAIDHQLTWFLGKYAPESADRMSWLAATRGFRERLRDEIAGIYQDRRPAVKAVQLNWLVVHEVRQLADRWKRGTLRDPLPGEPRLRPLALEAGTAAVCLGALLAAFFLVASDPVAGLPALLIAGCSGYQGVRRWSGIVLEKRRAEADKAESQRTYEKRLAEYVKYRDKFRDLQPSDPLMAEWLEYDKKVILRQALDYFGLRRTDVVSYAVLETPAASYKRASERDGPWRYSRYKIIVFLLTAGGIREVSYDLNTLNGEIQPLGYRSYRYDAIASVEAGLARGGSRQEFTVHLMDGKTIPFSVADALTSTADGGASAAELPAETDPDALSLATEDATGMRNTLRILRGVAADGKEWIAREAR